MHRASPPGTTNTVPARQAQPTPCQPARHNQQRASPPGTTNTVPARQAQPARAPQVAHGCSSCGATLAFPGTAIPHFRLLHHLNRAPRSLTNAIRICQQWDAGVRMGTLT
eukprot:363897-Chlamydomonas_euryale.AAC.1